MSNFKKNFGKRLKELRKARNLTQEQLAEAIEIALPNISYIENGRTYPSVETQEKLCKALEIKAYELYIFEDEITTEEMKKEIIKKLNNEKTIKSLYKYLKVINA